ncbi:hypothetical protein CEXT_232371 [Caerostris extrusa]|uniref:Uncharacterized protein n=1 Tax=Caerostris extrusa TaxID=172846 RepID=A0AAV4N6G8_CAEEX|nr:hypothetical protein CEXT_232371 [Caerostris extrusa]
MFPIKILENCAPGHNIFCGLSKKVLGVGLDVRILRVIPVFFFDSPLTVCHLGMVPQEEQLVSFFETDGNCKVTQQSERKGHFACFDIRR